MHLKVFDNNPWQRVHVPSAMDVKGKSLISLGIGK